MRSAIDLLREAGGDVVVPWCDEQHDRHRSDWSGFRYAGGSPLAVAFPRSTAQVSAIARACSATDTAIVPQGGLTGLHAPDGEGKPVLRRKLRRDQVETSFAALPPAIVGIEACSTSHHWARTIEAAGHTVRLIPPQYIKPFVKRLKTDSADAEAICKALRRAGIRDVAVKSREQQAALAVHRARDLLVRRRTMLTNAIRALPPSSVSWRDRVPGTYRRSASI